MYLLIRPFTYEKGKKKRDRERGGEGRGEGEGKDGAEIWQLAAISRNG